MSNGPLRVHDERIGSLVGTPCGAISKPFPPRAPTWHAGRSQPVPSAQTNVVVKGKPGGPAFRSSSSVARKRAPLCPGWYQCTFTTNPPPTHTHPRSGLFDCRIAGQWWSSSTRASTTVVFLRAWVCAPASHHYLPAPTHRVRVQKCKSTHGVQLIEARLRHCSRRLAERTRTRTRTRARSHVLTHPRKQTQYQRWRWMARAENDWKYLLPPASCLCSSYMRGLPLHAKLS